MPELAQTSASPTVAPTAPPLSGGPRSIELLRADLLALRDLAGNVGFGRAIGDDLIEALRPLSRLTDARPTPPALVGGGQTLLTGLRDVRDALEGHSLREDDPQRRVTLRSANFSTARAVVFLVDELSRLRAEQHQARMQAAVS